MDTLNLTLLFETKKGKSYQCDSSDSIIIEFDQKYYTYKFIDYVSFQRKVNSIDVLSMIYDLSDNCDSKLIENSKRNFSNKMTICEIIQLRELLNGTKFILSLNSLINTTLEISLT